MNKLIKLLALGTVLPLSLNSLNLVSVSYSSNNSLSTGVEDFTWAEEAFKLPKQCFERISYLVNENIKAKTASISNEESKNKYWAYKAINDKNAVYSESIKNLKIIYTVVREGGKQGLEILRKGILKTIENIVIENILNESSEDEETYKKLMGSLNALLITETINEMYHGSDKDDYSGFSSYDTLGLACLYAASVNKVLETVKSKFFGGTTENFKNSRNKLSGSRLLKLVECAISLQPEMKKMVKDCRYDQTIDSQDVLCNQLKLSLKRYMNHDWDCYLQQIGIIADIANGDSIHESVLSQELKLAEVEQVLTKDNQTVSHYDQLTLVEKIVEKSKNDEKLCNEMREINESVKNSLEKSKTKVKSKTLFEQSPYNWKYLRYIFYRDFWDEWSWKGDNKTFFDFVYSKMMKILPEILEPLASATREKNDYGSIILDILLYLDELCDGSISCLPRSRTGIEDWINSHLSHFKEFICWANNNSQSFLNIDKSKLASELKSLEKHNIKFYSWIKRMGIFAEEYAPKCNYFHETIEKEFLFRIASMWERMDDYPIWLDDSATKKKLSYFIKHYYKNVYCVLSDESFGLYYPEEQKTFENTFFRKNLKKFEDEYVAEYEASESNYTLLADCKDELNKLASRVKDDIKKYQDGQKSKSQDEE